MRLNGSVDGDIAAIIDEERVLLARDLRTGMVAAAAAVQAELRGQVRGAGLGAGLEKAWQKQVYPRTANRSLSPAGLVYSKSTILHQAFSAGATISARSGRYLAIPTREAEALGFATTNTTRAGGGTGAIPRRASMVRLAIERLGAENTRTIDLKSGRKLIVYTVPAGRGPGRNFRSKGGGIGFRRGAEVPLFVLVPQVRLRPRLDVAGVRSRTESILAAQIAAALAGR